jgi:hypothetical protein
MANATTNPQDTPQSNSKGVRYAVVGLGYIAQAAVLPAFKHAQENSQLVALISDDERNERNSLIRQPTAAGSSIKTRPPTGSPSSARADGTEPKS